MRKVGLFMGAILTMGLWPVGAQANVEDVIACRNISDDVARLACFDAAVPGLREELAEENAALEAERDQRSFFGIPSFDIPNILGRNQETSEEEFGSANMEQREAREEGTVDELEDERGIIQNISANVVEWGRNPRGKYFVVLDNGHVWRQTDDGRVPLRNRGENSVTIRRGRMGGFFLKANGVPAEFRFERIR